MPNGGRAACPGSRVQPPEIYITLHYITLHYIRSCGLSSATSGDLHYITLHYITLHSIMRALECNLRAFDVCARAASRHVSFFSFRPSPRPRATPRRLHPSRGREAAAIPSFFLPRDAAPPSPSLSVVAPLLSQLFMDFFFLGDVARNFNTAAVFEDRGSAQLIYDRARVAKM